VLLGVTLRKANYLDADPRQVAAGGLEFPGRLPGVSVVLMGDSLGSMYGLELKKLCEEVGCALRVVSVSAGDPLPRADRNSLWDGTLAAVRAAKPSHLIIACAWASKLKGDRFRLERALRELQPHVGKIILLDQPPTAPAGASRAAIRGGNSPPHFESLEVRRGRESMNAYLHSLQSSKVKVLAVAPKFIAVDGSVLVETSGRQLYQDSTHLSPNGTALLREDLRALLQAR
jgi:hypothetical protein